MPSYSTLNWVYCSPRMLCPKSCYNPGPTGKTSIALGVNRTMSL